MRLCISKNDKQRYPILLVIVVSVLAIGACFVACDQAEQKPACPLERVTIADASATLTRVALSRGYWLQEGLDLIVHDQPYGKTALQEVLDGKADIATVAATAFVLAAFREKKLSIIATIQSSRKEVAIVARKCQGMRAPADLRGKKIAVTLGTASAYFLEAFLSAHGIPLKTITRVDMKPDEWQDALTSGSVDAASAFFPWSFNIQKKLGNRGITFFDEDIYLWTYNIVATQEFVRNNPEKITKILRALIKAEQFTARNPAEAQKIVADSTRIDIGLLRDIWPDMKFSVSLDQALILAMEDESRWAMENQLTGGKVKIPNYLDFIYLDGLNAVKPKAVNILR